MGEQPERRGNSSHFRAETRGNGWGFPGMEPTERLYRLTFGAMIGSVILGTAFVIFLVVTSISG